MKKLMILLLALPMTNAFASTLSVDKGIDILILNGQDIIDQQDNYSLNSGQNQIVVDFSGRLSDKGKTEFLSTNPYVLTFDANSDVNVSLINKTYAKVEQANDQKQPIFTLTGANNVVQDVLPKGRGFVPYGDKDELLAKYNAEKGYNYGVAVAATTAVAAPVVYQQTNHQAQSQEQMKELNDTDTLNQLKQWYLKATEAEKVEFKQWLIFN